jgi:hypothetical protein
MTEIEEKTYPQEVKESLEESRDTRLEDDDYNTKKGKFDLNIFRDSC